MAQLSPLATTNRVSTKNAVPLSQASHSRTEVQNQDDQIKQIGFACTGVLTHSVVQQINYNVMQQTNCPNQIAAKLYLLSKTLSGSQMCTLWFNYHVTHLLQKSFRFICDDTHYTFRQYPVSNTTTMHAVYFPSDHYHTVTFTDTLLLQQYIVQLQIAKSLPGYAF